MITGNNIGIEVEDAFTFFEVRDCLVARNPGGGVEWTAYEGWIERSTIADVADEFRNQLTNLVADATVA